VDLSDSDLNTLLIAAGAVAVLLSSPACFHAIRLSRAEDAAANDPIARP
jgi:hypothetical protein